MLSEPSTQGTQKLSRNLSICNAVLVLTVASKVTLLRYRRRGTGHTRHGAHGVTTVKRGEMPVEKSGKTTRKAGRKASSEEIRLLRSCDLGSASLQCTPRPL